MAGWGTALLAISCLCIIAAIGLLMSLRWMPRQTDADFDRRFSRLMWSISLSVCSGALAQISRLAGS